LKLQEEKGMKTMENEEALALAAAAAAEVAQAQDKGTPSSSEESEGVEGTTEKGKGTISRKTSFLDQAASLSSGHGNTSGSGETKLSSSSNVPVRVNFHVGVHHDQGVRFSMEDAHSIHQPLDTLNTLIESSFSTSPSLTRHDCVFFGVYDGHGGTQASEYCREFLPSMIEHVVVSNISNKSNKSTEEQDQVIVESIVSTFRAVDVDFLKHCWDNGIGNVGTTVTTVLCCNGTIYCANAGDSRTVLCRNGQSINLSHDHKPTDTNEETRIRGCGGFVVAGVSSLTPFFSFTTFLCKVTCNATISFTHNFQFLCLFFLFFQRVMGKLAVSRAIGDSQFKRLKGKLMTDFSISSPLVIPDPDVTCTKIKPSEDEFIILACDGLWDVLTSQEAVDLVKKDLLQGMSVDNICEHLVNHALQIGSRDNVTAMVVMLDVV
jgi:protein phosphatase PTC2/3